MKEGFLVFISIFIVLFLTGGYMFLDYQNRKLDRYCKSCEKSLHQDDQDEDFLITFINQKDSEGNPIWMIIVDILFLFFLVVKFLFFSR